MANKRQNQIEITEQERCFASLIATGLWTQAAAHRVSFPESKVKEESGRRQLASNLSKRPQIISYIQTASLSHIAEKARVAVNGSSTIATGEDGKMTKDDIRRAMTENIQREPDPTKQNTLLRGLAELDALKGNDDNGNKDERISYYLPIVCYNCKLYADAKAKQSK